MPSWGRRLLALAAAAALAAASPAPDEVPTPEQVADMQLRLAMKQQADALQHGEDALAALHRLVDGANVTEGARAAAKAAEGSDDPDAEKRKDLKAAIERDLEALRSSVAAEVDERLREAAKAASDKLQVLAAGAAEKAKAAADKAQELAQKAKDSADAEAAAADKARRDFQEAVSYNSEEVAKILQREAAKAQQAAEELAQEQAEEEAREKERAAQAAAEAKKIADEAAETSAKERAARLRAEELERRASSTRAPSALFLAAADGDAGDAGDAGDDGDDDAEANAERVEKLAQRKAIADAPGRLTASLRAAVEQLQHLRAARERAVQQAFDEAHEKDLREIKSRVTEVKQAVEAMQGYAKTAAAARQTLGQQEPPAEDEDLAGEAEKLGAEATKLEGAIHSEAQRELKVAFAGERAHIEKEAHDWMAEADELISQVKKAGHKAEADAVALSAFTSSGSSSMVLAAVALGAACAAVLSGAGGRRTIRQQPLLLG